MNKILLMLLISTTITAACTNREDEQYWIKNREQLHTLSAQIRSIQSTTKLRYFTKKTADTHPVDKDDLSVVERDYPQKKKILSGIMESISTLNIIQCLSGDGYVAYVIKSGGLASDTILVNYYDVHGLDEFKKEFERYGFHVHTTKELEPQWRYVYTD